MTKKVIIGNNLYEISEKDFDNIALLDSREDNFQERVKNLKKVIKKYKPIFKLDAVLASPLESEPTNKQIEWALQILNSAKGVRFEFVREIEKEEDIIF